MARLHFPKLLILLLHLSSLHLCHPHPLNPQLIPRSLQIEQGGCPGILLYKLHAALRDAINLAYAGINAAANFNTVPFSYFFSSDIATANTVAAVLNRVLAAIEGAEPLDVLLSCTDHRNACLTTEGFSPGYAVQPRPGRPGVFGIVMCPDGLMGLRVSPIPCSDTPSSLGGVSLGSVMLHELVHLGNVAQLGVLIGDVAANYTAESVHVALEQGKNTTLDANAYQHMTSFAWGLGLGAPLWEGGTCLGNFSTADFELMYVLGKRA